MNPRIGRREAPEPRVLGFAVGGLIALAVFVQAPGRLIADTKLDLYVDPSDFLGRAVSLWDARSGFGYVANQRFGYLFPMGPWFAVLHALAVPMWVAQRMWMALILVVAYSGVLALARRIDIGGARSRILGAAAYALAPAFLTSIAFGSATLLPVALLPWVMVLLVDASRHGSVRRRLALAGLLVVAMGAVNATATLAVFAVPTVFVLTRSRGPRRRALAVGGALAVAAGCAWWLGPLLLEARYGVPFTDYTEKAATTTGTAAAFEAARGTSYWLGSFRLTGPWLPGGWWLASNPVLIIATGLLAAVGLAGLARRDMPERRWLALTALGGAVAIGAGYRGSLGGPFGASVQGLLDGALAPLRNVSKFDPLLRLPIVLGLIHAVSVARVPTGVRSRLDLRHVRALVAAAVALLVVVAATPLVLGHVAPAGSYRSVPSSWRDAAAWLSAHQSEGNAIVAPAASFGEYDWGRPLDEPLDPLARSPWAVRNIIPLMANGTTRLVDAWTTALEQGTTDLALTDSLRAAGVRFVVIRNDLDLRRTGGPGPGAMHARLASWPGMRRVATFGAQVAPQQSTDQLVAAGRAAAPRAIEIWATDRAATGPLVAESVAGHATGDPDALLATGRSGWLPITSGAAVATDGIARRDVSFADVRDTESYALTRTESAPGSGAAPVDRLVQPGAGNLSTVVMRGARSIVSSSYGVNGAREPEYQPASAFDRDPTTEWMASGPNSGAGEWIQVDLDRSRSVQGMTVQLEPGSADRGSIKVVSVVTDRGSARTRLADTSLAQTLAVPRGRTTSVRVRIETVVTNGHLYPGIREITIPGVHVDRVLALPRAASTPGAVALSRRRSDPTEATRRDEEAELRRSFRLAATADPVILATAVGRPGAALDATVDAAGSHLLVATASSSWNRLASVRPSLALDGDRSTSWVADPSDPTPTFTVSWTGPRPIDRIQMSTPVGPYRRATAVDITSASGEHRKVVLDGRGQGTFAPMTTDRLRIDIVTSAPSVARRGDVVGVLPRALAVSELDVPQLADLERPAPAASTPVVFACGQGPTLTIDGHEVQTAVRTTVGALTALRQVPATVCSNVAPLAGGEHRLVSSRGPALSVATVTIQPVPPVPPGRIADIGGRLTQVRWSGSHGRATVARGAAGLLVLASSANRGWHATVAGHALRAVTVDGWRQGFVLPAAAAGAVHITYPPDHTLRVVLGFGALLVLGLVVAALVRPRRSAAEKAAVGPATGGWPLAVAVAAVAVVLFLIGGVLVIATVPIVYLARRAFSLASIVAALLLAATCLAAPGLFVSGYGPYSAGVQLLAVLAFGALAASLIPPRTPTPSHEERVRPG